MATPEELPGCKVCFRGLNTLYKRVFPPRVLRVRNPAANRTKALNMQYCLHSIGGGFSLELGRGKGKIEKFLEW